MKFISHQVKGRGRGKLLGFPTINMHIPENFKLEEGIYAANVEIEGKVYKGALHFGPIPTFNEDENVLEVFLIDADENFHLQDSSKLNVEIKKRLRDIIRFENPYGLVKQIEKDVELAISILK